MKKFIYPLGLLLLPAVAGAAVIDSNEGLGKILQFVGDLIATVIPLIIGLAVLLFLWGVLKYVTSGGDPEKRTEARNTMIWGIIAIFVMVSVWGLVNILVDTFGLDNDVQSAPGIPPPPSDTNW